MAEHALYLCKLRIGDDGVFLNDQLVKCTDLRLSMGVGQLPSVSMNVWVEDVIVDLSDVDTKVTEQR